MKRVWIVLLCALALYGIEVGERAARVSLQPPQGYCVASKKPFDTGSLTGRVTLFVYVDPDKRGENEEFFAAIKRQHFPSERFNSVVVVNMAATWLPNFILSSILQKKQRDYPRTLYVKDFAKTFVKAWGLRDNAMNIVIFSRNGRVLFVHAGKLSPAQQRRALAILKEGIEHD